MTERREEGQESPAHSEDHTTCTLSSKIWGYLRSRVPAAGREVCRGKWAMRWWMLKPEPPYITKREWTKRESGNGVPLLSETVTLGLVKHGWSCPGISSNRRHSRFLSAYLCQMWIKKPLDTLVIEAASDSALRKLTGSGVLKAVQCRLESAWALRSSDLAFWT